MKPHHNTLVLTQKRLLAVLLLAAFLFLSLIARLGFLTMGRGREFQVKALDQWTRDLPLVAIRGDILDAEGRTLASSYMTYSVYVRPRAVTDKAAVARTLSECLRLDYDEVLTKISKRVSEVTIAKAVSKADAEKIKDSNLSGILFGESSSRVYPYSELLSRVLGFTNIDSVGSTGLEAYYDKYLKGVDGKALTSTDLIGQETGAGTMYIPSISGMALQTSLDLEIQKMAEWITADAMAKYRPKSASCLVMDVNTGGIVAMSTAPTFDLNAPPRDDIDALNALSKNLLLTDVYEPGSTFKIFTTVAALEEGLTHAYDRFYDPGFRIVDGKRIKCWRSHGHGSQTLAEGVQNSCNCVFMDLALRLGTNRLYSYLHKFGFGEKTGMDFFGESKGIMMRESRVKNVDLARIGFGQAVACTPVQVLGGVSAAVNGGLSVQPHFGENASNGTDTVALYNSASKRVISAKTSKLMTEMLELVVAKGGGRNAAVPGYRIGGKTGTAQKYENGVIASGKYVSSFVGFAPVESPKYAVMVLVDEPQGWIYYGSQVAAPYASRLFKGIFDYKQIAPAYPARVNVGMRQMPDLRGKTVERAAEILEAEGFTYEVVGTSGAVVDQFPTAGAEITANSCILLKL